MNFYPGYKEPQWYPKKTKGQKLTMMKEGTATCPLCHGKGVKKDLKTLEMRDCCLCKSTGKVKPYK